LIRDGVLQLLPGHGLDQSILIAVLFGMAFLLLLNEAFGWVYVGLVVPGYLASVFVIQPAAAVAVVFESIICFWLAKLVSDGFSRLGGWSSFFGRERFFLIVMLSVFVRQASQMWLLPFTLTQIDHQFGTTFRSDQNFFSIGLVLVPLTANMFWKLGVRQGFVQVAFPVAATFLILKFALLPMTNLSLSELELTYENVALDFLGSPKAYMILLCTAVLAARYNLAFGWDYNGILVPSLLALIWFSPQRVFITIAEALVLLFTTRAVLAIPLFRTINLEGPRKVFTVFLTGFALKCAVGWITIIWFPQIKITEFMGFGYVLTSLLAVKMLQKKMIGTILLPTILVSAIGFATGSGIGFLLDQIAPKQTIAIETNTAGIADTRALVQEPLGVMVMARLRARPVVTPALRDGRSGSELGRVVLLWRAVNRWIETDHTPAERESAKLDVEERAKALGLHLRRLDTPSASGPRYVLAEAEERLRQQVGWETAVISPGEPGPILEVPRPRFEVPSAEFAAIACKSVRCRAILVSGVDLRLSDSTKTGDPLVDPRSTFQVAHVQLTSAPIVQIRADVRNTADRATLHLRHLLPNEVHLSDLWPSTVALSWEKPALESQQWAERSNFSILRAHPDQFLNVLSELHGRPVKSIPEQSLSSWISHRNELSASQTQFVASPSETEVYFLESIIAESLLARDTARLPWLNRMASLLGYEIVELPNCVGEDACWVASDPVGRRRWGDLVVRKQRGKAIAVEVPRPTFEPGTSQLGIELWDATRAEALVIATARAGTIDTEDDETMLASARTTPFQGLHQALHRTLSVRPTPLIVQVRGVAGWRPVPEELIIALGAPILQASQIPESLRGIVAGAGPLGWLADTTGWADGSAQFVTLTGNSTPQMIYSRAAGGVDLALLWFSQDLREKFRRSALARHEQQLEMATGAEIPISRETPTNRLLTPPLVQADASQLEPLRLELKELLRFAQRYAYTNNGHDLVALRLAARQRARRKIELAWSESLGMPIAFMEVAAPTGETLRAMVMLSGQVTEDTDTLCPVQKLGDVDIARNLRQMTLQRCRSVRVFGRSAEVISK